MGILWSPLGRAGAIGTIAAVIVNLLIYGIGSAADINWDVGDNDPDTATVALTTILAGALATILAMVLLRYVSVKRPLVTFLAISVLFAVLSLAAPLGADAETSTRWVLALMHVVAGVFIIGALGYELKVAERSRAASD